MLWVLIFSVILCNCSFSNFSSGYIVVSLPCWVLLPDRFSSYCLPPYRKFNISLCGQSVLVAPLVLHLEVPFLLQRYPLALGIKFLKLYSLFFMKTLNFVASQFHTYFVF